jgi:DNA-binding NarL/FixJ family response regulator
MSHPVAHLWIEKKVKEILRIRQKQWLSEMKAPASTHLSRREWQVFLCSIMGYTAGAMASLLNISTKTAESYLAEVKSKLECSSRVELFAKAIEFGVVFFTV